MGIYSFQVSERIKNIVFIMVRQVNTLHHLVTQDMNTITIK